MVISSEYNKFKIKIGSCTETREILNLINKNHNILSFKKNIASIEDIFIKSVNNE